MCPHCADLRRDYQTLQEVHLRALKMYDALQHNTEELAKLVDCLRWQLLLNGITPDYLLEIPPKKAPVSITTRRTLMLG